MTWVLEGGIIVEQAAGRHIPVTAEAVLAQADGAGVVVPGFTGTLDVLDIPHTVRLRISGDSLTGLACAVVAGNADDAVQIPRDAEGCVTGRQWQPIRLDDRDGAWRLHDLAEAGPDGTLTLGGYLRLLADPDSRHFASDMSVHSADEARWPPRALISPPKGLQATLYPYQLIGQALLRALAGEGLGCLLADEMGLGKTLQIISLMAAELTPDARALVVAPGSLLINWARELERFAPWLSLNLHVGRRRPRIPRDIEPRPQVTITSYDTAVTDVDMLAALRWDLIVLDEAQRIKNAASGRSRALKRIPGRVRVAVTGTPVENSLTDLWSLTEFIAPFLLGAEGDFRAQFPDEVRAARHLGAAVAPLVIRRRVREVADDLPPRTEQEVPLHMPPGMAAAHADLEASGAPFGAHSALSVLTAHAEDDGPVGPAFSEAPKVQAALTLLESAFDSQAKVIVFAEYTNSLDRLATAFREEWPEGWFAVIDGRTTPGGRQAVLDEFADLPSPAALLVSPRAGGEGLNITAASHVIHFSPSWNPAVTEQATARAYRRGQSAPVFVHHLCYLGSIDERAIARATWKRDLADAVHAGIVTRDRRATSAGEDD